MWPLAAGGIAARRFQGVLRSLQSPPLSSLPVALGAVSHGLFLLSSASVFSRGDISS